MALIEPKRYGWRGIFTRVLGMYEIIPWWMGAAWRMEAQLATRFVVIPFHIPARFGRSAWWWMCHPWRGAARFEEAAVLKRQLHAMENKRKSDRLFNEQDVKSSYSSGWTAGYKNAYEVMGAMVGGGGIEAAKAALDRPENPDAG